jgi:hypothetical protein
MRIHLIRVGIRTSLLETSGMELCFVGRNFFFVYKRILFERSFIGVLYQFRLGSIVAFNIFCNLFFTIKPPYDAV